jgi:TIR domain
MADGEFDIFLAHNSYDKSHIRAIHYGLKRRGLKPWLDEERIVAGQSFQKVIQIAVPAARSAAVFLGQDGLGNWQEEEVELLLDTCKKAGKPLFLVLLPGVNDADIPYELGFLKQKHWVSFNDGRNKALDEIESGVRGLPTTPFSDVLLCYNNDDLIPVREVEAQLQKRGVDTWKQGLNASSLQLSVLRNVDEQLNRIWSLAVCIGSSCGPWEQDIVADVILEFRESHRPVIPVILNTAPNSEIRMPVYLRRLGLVDFRVTEPSAIDRLVLGVIDDAQEPIQRLPPAQFNPLLD